MAEQGDHDADSVEETPGYQPPKPKAIDDILGTDKDDESLEKYKKSLLGDGADAKIVIDENNPHNVIVNKLTLLSEGRPDMELDLTQDLAAIKKKHFILKEGCQYRIKISFYVQREIVAGLKYTQKSYRKGINVDTTNLMVGSYGPKRELQSYTSGIEEAPSGMISRGSYSIKSKFLDDDKKSYLNWEWNLDIKKDWE